MQGVYGDDESPCVMCNRMDIIRKYLYYYKNNYLYCVFKSYLDISQCTMQWWLRRKKQWLKQKSQGSQIMFRCRGWEEDVQMERMGEGMPMSQPTCFAHPGRRSTGSTADMSRLALTTRSLSRNNGVDQPGKNSRLQDIRVVVWMIKALYSLALTGPWYEHVRPG